MRRLARRCGGLAAGPATVEVQRRLEKLTARLAGLARSSSGLQALRAVEILEQIGTPEARRLLETLAQGAADAPLTRKARASLEWLARRGH